MGYATHDVRTAINEYINFNNCQLEDCEQLQYVITKICIHYLKLNGLKFQTVNDVIGILDTVKDDIRQQAKTVIKRPYEDLKIV